MNYQCERYRKAVIAPALIVIFGGCAGHPDPIIGTWSTTKALGAGRSAKMSYKFNPDHTGLQSLDFLGQNQSVQFTYTDTGGLLTETPVSMLLNGKPKPLSSKNQPIEIFYNISGSSMTFANADGVKLTFARQK